LIVSIEDIGGELDSDFVDAQSDISPISAPQSKGLGQSIAKKLVELHKGAFHVESIIDKWSRFWFVLPKAYPED